MRVKSAKYFRTMDPLRCRVKAGAVANLTDARYFAALGVDYMGFALEPGAEGHISPLELAAFREWIEGPALVGEFGGMDTASIEKLAEELKLDVIQVGPFGKTQEVAKVTGLPILQEIVLGGDVGPQDAQPILNSNAGSVTGFILNFSRNKVQWETLQAEPTWIEWLTETCADFPVLLDIPAPASLVDDILTTLEPVGVQVHGGEEEAVGLKSYDELDEWMEVLQVE